LPQECGKNNIIEERRKDAPTILGDGIAKQGGIQQCKEEKNSRFRRTYHSARRGTTSTRKTTKAAKRKLKGDLIRYRVWGGLGESKNQKKRKRQRRKN